MEEDEKLTSTLPQLLLLSVTPAVLYEVDKEQGITMKELHQRFPRPTERPSLLVSKLILESEEYWAM
jgi:hypothetical protein